MARPTKEMQAERAADAAWRKAVAANAQLTVVSAIVGYGRPEITVETPTGSGLSVIIRDPEGTPRRYFVRLTETGPYDPVVLP